MLDDRALLAVQGPDAENILQGYFPDVGKLRFMEATKMDYLGLECFVSRSGYTGEDGFEISIPATDAEQFAQNLLANERVRLVGLGARDSLRLEAGLCLYGQDLDAQTNLLEADLWWSVSPARRPGGVRAGGFAGADALFALREQGVQRRRVALQVNERTPVRAGAELFDQHENKVGKVTSGGFSPSLERPIAMAYLATELAHSGTSLFAKVRNKLVAVEVVSLPFVSHKYKRG
jgi:aminomethyltransferase